MPADYAAWNAAIKGGNPPIHEDEPWQGYFKMRDRRGLNMKKAPIKRPFIACAIWRDKDGKLRAELAKKPVPVDWVWPYCARHPITYETYAYWHQHDSWPNEEKAA